MKHDPLSSLGWLDSAATLGRSVTQSPPRTPTGGAESLALLRDDDCDWGSTRRLNGGRHKKRRQSAGLFPDDSVGCSLVFCSYRSARAPKPRHRHCGTPEMATPVETWKPSRESLDTYVGTVPRTSLHPRSSGEISRLIPRSPLLITILLSLATSAHHFSLPSVSILLLPVAETHRKTRSVSSQVKVAVLGSGAREGWIAPAVATSHFSVLPASHRHPRLSLSLSPNRVSPALPRASLKKLSSGGGWSRKGGRAAASSVAFLRVRFHLFGCRLPSPFRRK